MEDNLEQMLEYNNLIQTYMISTLTVKRMDLQEKKNKNSILAIEEKYKNKQKQLFKLEKDIINIQNLIKLSIECDNQLTEVAKIADLFTNSRVKHITQELDRILKSLSTLQCKKVRLPETQEEIEDFLDCIKKLSTTLKRIQLSDSSNIFGNFEEKFNNFTSLEVEIDNVIKELTSNLNDLQILVLKHTSETFTQE